MAKKEVQPRPPCSVRTSALEAWLDFWGLTRLRHRDSSPNMEDFGSWELELLGVGQGSNEWDPRIQAACPKMFNEFYAFSLLEVNEAWFCQNKTNIQQQAWRCQHGSLVKNQVQSKLISEEGLGAPGRRQRSKRLRPRW